VTSIIYGIKEPAFLLKIGGILICLSLGLNVLMIPKYGAIGAGIATSIPRLIALPIYIHFVSRKINQPWPMSEALRITLATAIMGLVIFPIQYYLDTVPGLCLSIPAGIIVYVVVLLAFRLVNNQDIKMLKQFGERLPAILKKVYMAAIGVLAKFAKA
jgi:O-antigen/teichoic acid export membrane protein